MYAISSRFAFIAHPRMASRACKQLLLDLGADRAEAHHRIHEATIREIYNLPVGICACTVRNMFDVLISWYFNINPLVQKEKWGYDRKPTFDEWLHMQIERPTNRWLATPIYHYGLPYANRRMRYERLNDELNLLLKELNFAPRELPVIGVSKGRKPYREYYNDTLRRMVEKRWAEDLHLTGYEF